MRQRLLRASAVLSLFAAALLGPFLATAHADPVPVQGGCVDVYGGSAGGATVCTPWD